MNPVKKGVIAVALAGSTLLGGALGATMLGTAGAQTDSSSTTAPAAPSAQDPGGGARGGSHDPTKGGHVGENGTTETLLTGDTAQKVTDAALAAVPGGAIQRVENDAEGSPYEAHMTKADGSHVTVKVGADFTVTSVEEGHR
jgi:hypothetical protein